MNDPTISEIMATYASDAVSHAERIGITLDFSEESLSQVDVILADLAGENLMNSQDPEIAENAWTISKAYGGYIGEVVIRSLGGTWELEDLDDNSCRPVLTVLGIKGFPPEKVYKRLTEDPYSGVGGYLRALRAIIERSTEAES